MCGVQPLSLTSSGQIIFLLYLVISLSGCQLGSERSYRWAETECTGCIAALPVNGWCDQCSHGLVAGLAIPSREFHDALDAHGHEVDTETILCNLCRQVAREDQFCPRCRHGFVAGQLYFSELTWSLARGEAVAPDLPCADCSESAGTIDQCNGCQRYWVGTVCFISKQNALRAEGQYRRLLVALDRLPACQECAMAGFFGMHCHSCSTEPIPNPLK